MGPEGPPVLLCAECGSTRLRAGHPHGFAEQLGALTGARFHVCTECGTRGTHRGQYRSRRVKRARAPFRPIERRDIRTAGALARRRVGLIAIAIGLGAWLGLYVSTCENRMAAQRPDVVSP